MLRLPPWGFSESSKEEMQKIKIWNAYIRHVSGDRFYFFNIWNYTSFTDTTVPYNMNHGYIYSFNSISFAIHLFIYQANSVGPDFIYDQSNQM